jgi:LCCL domain
MRMLPVAAALSGLLAGAVLSGAEFAKGERRIGGTQRSTEPTTTANRTGTAAPSSATAINEDGRFAMVLKDGTQFVGEPLKLDPVPLETDFGKVRVPLKLVAGFEPSKKSGAILIHFKNGDTLTARLPLAGLQVKTRYGTINVPLSELASANAGDKLRPQPDESVAEKPKNVLPDPGTLTGFAGMIGKSMYFRVTGAIRGTIWGTDSYTADSALATAAVHAGAVNLGATGIVKVTIVAGMPFHVGSVRNGVSSSSYGAYSFSYRIEKRKRRTATSPRSHRR